MIRILAAFCLLFPALCLSARAAEPIELAADLGYLRIHSLVVEREFLAAALRQSRALVLDLRYPLDERDAGEVLRQELSSQTTKPRLYVLVSPATPVPIVGAIASSQTKLITLGVKGSRPEPQVAVLQVAADDRRAFDAFTRGTPLAELISGKIEKERYDEATLVQEFNNGAPEPKPLEVTPAPTTEPPPRLTDRVLQRTLHLHRALQTLRR